MAKRHVLGLLPLALLLQAASDGGHMTVLQVMENKAALDGKTVTVRGWLPKCAGLFCALYDSRAAGEAGPKDKRGNRYLGIGDYPEFDKKVSDELPAFVILRAKFDAKCVGDPNGEIIVFCTDRVSTLTKIEIVRIDPF